MTSQPTSSNTPTIPLRLDAPPEYAKLSPQIHTVPALPPAYTEASGIVDYSPMHPVVPQVRAASQNDLSIESIEDLSIESIEDRRIRRAQRVQRAESRLPKSRWTLWFFVGLFIIIVIIIFLAV
ncbi:Membrane protein US8A [Caenorhabditis elegans]|uniref:Membrane protein US8A n=1 Tax=Caenorhabditis elegans TaxID=6239 RepID=D3KFV1_CAEEL|nr:Membrane protein US8A [Caenorhabditis elegans]CBJ25088.1 Membrane protein US8A [Caenorhabditis elegans]|eukprot:NP_001255684.1 Uncharacterized protein CELE_K08D8.7 [Caenorhabditis elegans]